MRQLVKDLAGRHTVRLSTHILPEAEMTCQRVLIMQQGRIVAEGGPDQLQQLMSGSTQIVAEIAAPLPELQALFHQMSEIESCDVAPAEGPFYRCAITPVGGADLRTLIADLARQQGWPLRELTRSRYSLEDIFMRVTRHEEEEG